MEEIRCLHCGKLRPKSPRHKKQDYCGAKKCQKARKAAWQREKIRTDPDYRANQKAGNEKWNAATPGYWKIYRAKNPEKTERNRMLQRIRNRCRTKKVKDEVRTDVPLIAKMDASKSSKFKVNGEFWLIPTIAKMDASKVLIREISTNYD